MNSIEQCTICIIDLIDVAARYVVANTPDSMRVSEDILMYSTGTPSEIRRIPTNGISRLRTSVYTEPDERPVIRASPVSGKPFFKGITSLVGNIPRNVKAPGEPRFGLIQCADDSINCIGADYGDRIPKEQRFAVACAAVQRLHKQGISRECRVCGFREAHPARP